MNIRFCKHFLRGYCRYQEGRGLLKGVCGLWLEVLVLQIVLDEALNDIFFKSTAGLSWQRCVVSLLQLMSLWRLDEFKMREGDFSPSHLGPNFSQWPIPYGFLHHSQSRVVESVVLYQPLPSNAAEGQVWLCTLQRGGGKKMENANGPTKQSS